MQQPRVRRLPTFLLLGPPGSGKGTQARMLRNTQEGFVHVDFGHERRRAVLEQSSLAAIRMKQLGDLVSRGKFLDDSMVCGVFRDVVHKNEFMLQNDQARGIILEGFPRNLGQAKWMTETKFGNDAAGSSFGLEISLAVVLHAPFKVLLRRIEGRLIHEQSGRTYHPTENPPLFPFKDDITGETLVPRTLSTKLAPAEALQMRLSLDEKETGPLIHHLESQGKVVHMDKDRDECWFRENRRHPAQLHQAIQDTICHLGWSMPQSRRSFSSVVPSATASVTTKDVKSKQSAPLRHVAIVGLGPHARRIYFPYLCKQLSSEKPSRVSVPLVIDMEDQRHVIGETVDACPQSCKPRVVYVAECDRHLRTVPSHVCSELERLRRVGKLDGLIISSEPSSHEPYLRWALERGVHVLVDKPPLVPVPFRSHKLTSDFEKILGLAAHSPSRTTCMVQRRAHPGYQFVRRYLSEFIREFGMPISYLDVFHADGMWCMPGEFERENHPYKNGYGKLIHSGYHFLDLLSWLGNSASAHGPEAETTMDGSWDVIRACAFDTGDYAEQLEQFDLERLSGASAEEINESYRKFRRLREKRSLGEINVHALLRSGACVASVNLLQNSFSRRAWYRPARDVYKGNGRVRHERLVANVGPLLSIHVHSYQSHEVGKCDAAPPKTGSPLTQKLLQEVGISPDEIEMGCDPGTTYMPGNVEHFDVTIYRNSEVCGGPAFESIPFGKVIADGQSNVDRENWIGHNECARELILEKWLAGQDCDCSLETQREPMYLLDAIYEDLNSVDQQSKPAVCA